MTKRWFSAHTGTTSASVRRTKGATASTSDGWFFHSDHYNFVKQGVPAVVVENGLHPADPGKLNRYPMASWYHKPCDEYREDWDLSDTLANTYLFFSVGLSVANSDTTPRTP